MYEELKKRRLELGKTLEEIAEKTKIKKHCLQLIEEGKFDELPIEVYTRAYIKTYAESIGIDPSIILKDYEEYLKTKKQNIQQIELKPKFEPEPKPENLKKSSDKKIFSFKKFPTWAITAGIIFAVILIIIFLIQFDKKEYEIPPPPSIKQEIIPENTKVQEKIDKNEQKQEISTHQQSLKIEAIDKVWMRITVDDKEKKEFLLNPGQKIELQADKSFKLHIGNAGGVKILFNDKDLGKLGETGQVVYLNLPQDKN